MNKASRSKRDRRIEATEATRVAPAEKARAEARELDKIESDYMEGGAAGRALKTDGI